VTKEKELEKEETSWSIPMTCQITRITIYGMVNIRFSEVLKKLNETEVDMDLRLKKEENGEEMDVPVEWRLAGFQG
jgi:hypothetical protein